MELYKIAVSVQLRNMMHGALRTLRDDLGLTDRAVNRLQSNLRKLETTQRTGATAARRSGEAQAAAAAAAAKHHRQLGDARLASQRLLDEKEKRESAFQARQKRLLQQADALEKQRGNVASPSRRGLQSQLANNKKAEASRLAPLLAEEARLKKIKADANRSDATIARRQARQQAKLAKHEAGNLNKTRLNEMFGRMTWGEIRKSPEMKGRVPYDWKIPKGLSPEKRVPKKDRARLSNEILKEQESEASSLRRDWKDAGDRETAGSNARNRTQAVSALERNKAAQEAAHAARKAADAGTRNQHRKEGAVAEKERNRLLRQENSERDRAEQAAERHRRGQSVLDTRISAEEHKEAQAAERKAAAEEKVTKEAKEQEKLRKKALADQREMAKLQKAQLFASRRRMLGTFGAGAAIAGGVGLYGLGKFMSPALDTAHQNFLLKTTGVTERELAAINKAAPGLQRAIPTIRADELRESYLHVKQTFGLKGKEMTDDEMSFVLGTALPEIGKSAAALRVLQPDKYQSLPNTIVALMRSMDIRALTQKEDYPKLESELKAMSKMITASGGVITPMVMQGTLKYARQFAGTISEDFLYKYLPTLVQENMTAGGGGGGRGNVGTMLQSFGSMFVAGRLSRRAMRMWNELGVLPDSSLVKDGNQVRVDSTKGFVNQKLMDENFGLWIQQEIVPRVIQKLKDSGVRNADGDLTPYDDLSSREQRQAVDRYLIRAPGNSTGMALMSALVRSWPSILRDENSRSLAQDYDGVMRRAMSEDFPTLMNALSAQWFNLREAMGRDFVPTIMAVGVGLNDAMAGFTTLVNDNPGLASGALNTAFGASIAALLGGMASLTVWAGAHAGRGLLFMGRGIQLAVHGLLRFVAVFSLPVWGKLALVGATIWGIASSATALVNSLMRIPNLIMDMVDVMAAGIREDMPTLFGMFGPKGLLPGDAGYQFRDEANRLSARRAALTPGDGSGPMTPEAFVASKQEDQPVTVQFTLDNEVVQEYLLNGLTKKVTSAGSPLGPALSEDPLALADLASAH